MSTTMIKQAPDLRREPRWVSAALVTLLLASCAVYASGIREELIHNYYGPAVKSMSESWQAFFWGSFDAASTITIDKLPGALQIQALAARLFGYSTWTVLGPQVVEAGIAIWALFATVRRWVGPRTGLVAAAMLATTPIVAALAHAQISDMALTMLLTVAAYCWTRAVQAAPRPGTGWLLLTGVVVGFAFQTKMVQAWGVLPALGLAYLLCAGDTWLRRCLSLLLASAVTTVVSLWWLIVATLTPASSRPYIDGSTDNSAWSMVFGYNLSSRYGDSGMDAPGGASGWGYMVSPEIATQVGWLYPLALLGIVIALWRGRGAPRTDLLRAGVVMSTLWFVAHAVAFSLGRVAHSFYVIAVAPAVAALATAGLALAWRAYRERQAVWMLPAGIGATLVWGAVLSLQYPSFQTWVVPASLGLGTVAVIALAVRRWPRQAVAGALVAMLLTPALWSASTASSQYSGSNIGPAAGPAGDGMGNAGPGGTPPGASDGQPGPQSSSGAAAGQPPRQPGQSQGQAGGPPPGGAGNRPGQAPNDTDRRSGGQRGMEGAAVSTTVDWLKSHDPGSTYLLAVFGSQAAGPYVQAGVEVLPIGGFTGSAPSITLPQLKQLIARGELRYIQLDDHGGGGMGLGDETTVQELKEWVRSDCTAVEDSSVSEIYDCASS